MIQKNLTETFSYRTWTRILLFVSLIFLGGSVWGLRTRVMNLDREMRSNLLHHANALARTINVDWVRALTFSAADEELVEFKLLEEQLRAYHSVIGCRGIYTIKLNNGVLVFGPESYPSGDPDSSMPGTIYQQPDPSMFQTLKIGHAYTEGPTSDEYGTFVSALAPIKDPRNGETLILVGLDVEAEAWKKELQREFTNTLLWILGLALLFYGGIWAVWQRNRLPMQLQEKFRYLEAVFLLVFFFSVTIAVTLDRHQNENRIRQEAFRQLAETQSQLIQNSFNLLRDHQLNAIIRFFESSDFVDRGEFRTFSASTIRKHYIRSIEWVPAIPESDKNRWENNARREGMQEFAIWQTGRNGERETVKGRDVYFPVWYVEPLEEYRSTLGFDLGSDPVRLAAIEETIRNGMVTLSEVVTFEEGEQRNSVLLVFDPVTLKSSNNGSFDGFIVARLNIDSFIRSAMTFSGIEDEPAIADLFQLSEDDAPILLSSSSSVIIPVTGQNAFEDLGSIYKPKETSEIFPLFIFGKAYGLVIYPGDSFIRAYPSSAGLSVFLIGMLFTCLITLGSLYFIRSRYALESEVVRRTNDFTESETRYRLLVDQSPYAIIVHQNGEIIFSNRATRALLGVAHSDDIEGRPITSIIHHSDQSAALQRIDQMLAGDSKMAPFEERFIRMDGSSIPVEVAASRIRLQGHPAVQMIANDISERKRTNQKIETQLKRLAALHEIDSAISGSFDLRSIITLILDKTINQLNVDAARVLLLNLYTHTLDQISSLGFHTRGNRYRDTRLGLGFASRAVLEHRVISINDINDTHEYPNERSLWESEGFCAYHGAPLIVKGDVKGVLEVFSRPISNTQERDTEWLYFLETLAGQAAIAVDNSELFEGLQRANVELVLAYDATIEGWSQAMDLRDRETEGHTKRVMELTLQLAGVMGVKDSDMVHFRRGALLHDIGKLGVPDNILLKTQELTEDEWKVMHRHPQFAFEMLAPISYLKPALDIPYCHHERWDGNGYPRGLKQEQIPLAARIFTVVDVWDALLYDRPYRKAWPKERVIAYLQEQRGHQFDPLVVDHFMKIIRENRSGIFKS